MIRNFKAAHKKGWYSSEDKYLDAVYRKNRAEIDAAYNKVNKLLKDKGVKFDQFASFRTRFKAQVRITQEANQVSITKAVKIYANKPIFKTKGEVGVDNFLSGLKKDPAA